MKVTANDLRLALYERGYPLHGQQPENPVMFGENFYLGLQIVEGLVKHLARTQVNPFAINARQGYMVRSTKLGQEFLAIVPWLTGERQVRIAGLNYHPAISLLIDHATAHGVTTWTQAHFEWMENCQPVMLANTLNGLGNAVRESAVRQGFRHAVQRHEDEVLRRYKITRVALLRLLKDSPLLIGSRFELQALPLNIGHVLRGDQQIRFQTALISDWLCRIRSAYGSAILGTAWKIDFDAYTSTPYVHAVVLHDGIAGSEILAFRAMAKQAWLNQGIGCTTAAYDRTAWDNVLYMRCSGGQETELIGREQDLENIAAYLCLTDKLCEVGDLTGCKTSDLWIPSKPAPIVKTS